MSRFPPIEPHDLTPDQKETYNVLRDASQAMFGDKFVWKTESGALVGPMAPLLYLPVDVSRHFFGMAMSLPKVPLPSEAREAAILSVGAHFGAAYEIYSHERVAASSTELTESQINGIKSGEKPTGISEAASVAYDLGKALVHKRGPLEDVLWNRAVAVLGSKESAQACVQYVGFYAYTCILLNAAEVPVPNGEKIK